MEANEYRELTPEEIEQLRPMFKEGALQPYVRIGPKGYIFTKDHCVKHAPDIFNMELRKDDVFVASYQRSGTTWTQELVWLIVKNFDYEKAAAVPLTHRYVFLELAGFFTETLLKSYPIRDEKTLGIVQRMSTPGSKILGHTPSPRFVKTHLPMSLLPNKLLDTAKVVYVARDPRDVIVSSFHHGRLYRMTQYIATFRETWNAFRDDLFVLTPYFEHVKEAWALRKHPNMLFLFYEDLVKDLPAAVALVSEFFGKEVTPAQMEQLCSHLDIKNFKNNKSVNQEEMREIRLFESDETFIRQGKSGGWRDYFDEEMTREAEEWIAYNLRDTDLIFPSMTSSNSLNSTS